MDEQKDVVSTYVTKHSSQKSRVDKLTISLDELSEKTTDLLPKLKALAEIATDSIHAPEPTAFANSYLKVVMQREFKTITLYIDELQKIFPELHSTKAALLNSYAHHSTQLETTLISQPIFKKQSYALKARLQQYQKDADNLTNFKQALLNFFQSAARAEYERFKNNRKGKQPNEDLSPSERERFVKRFGCYIYSLLQDPLATILTAPEIEDYRTQYGNSLAQKSMSTFRKCIVATIRDCKAASTRMGRAAQLFTGYEIDSISHLKQQFNQFEKVLFAYFSKELRDEALLRKTAEFDIDAGFEIAALTDVAYYNEKKLFEEKYQIDNQEKIIEESVSALGVQTQSSFAELREQIEKTKTYVAQMADKIAAISQAEEKFRADLDDLNLKAETLLEQLLEKPTRYIELAKTYPQLEREAFRIINGEENATHEEIKHLASRLAQARNCIKDGSHDQMFDQVRIELEKQEELKVHAKNPSHKMRFANHATTRYKKKIAAQEAEWNDILRSVCDLNEDDGWVGLDKVEEFYKKSTDTLMQLHSKAKDLEEIKVSAQNQINFKLEIFKVLEKLLTDERNIKYFWHKQLNKAWCCSGGMNVTVGKNENIAVPHGIAKMIRVIKTARINHDTQGLSIDALNNVFQSLENIIAKRLKRCSLFSRRDSLGNFYDILTVILSRAREEPSERLHHALSSSFHLLNHEIDKSREEIPDACDAKVVTSLLLSAADVEGNMRLSL